MNLLSKPRYYPGLQEQLVVDLKHIKRKQK